MPLNDRASGFTLLEMALVITISGLMTAGIFAAINQDGQVKSTRMNNTMDALLLGMGEYYRIYGYYPCPADPRISADASNPNFGKPVLSGGNCVAATGGLSAPGAGGGTVIIGTVPVRALNEAMGCTPTDGTLPDNLTQTFQNKLNTASQIFFGAAADYSSYDDFDKNSADDRVHDNITETSRKCVTNNFIKDIYGSKITYAVNLAATKLHQTPPDGNIEVVNRAGQRATEDRVNFVLVSHGKDRKGAYMAHGSVQSFPCGSGTALDDENCDNDAVFRAMPYSAMTDMYAANNFDDRVEFSLMGYLREKDVWRWAEGSSGTQRNMVFDAKEKQGLTIGIPQTTPSDDEKLGVYGGNIQVDGNLTAQGSTGSATALIKAEETVTADKNIDAGTKAIAPRFCYAGGLYSNPATSPNCN